MSVELSLEMFLYLNTILKPQARLFPPQSFVEFFALSCPSMLTILTRKVPKRNMSRISISLATLALLALAGTPSVVARVGGETVSKPLNHSMLRRELQSTKLPLADKSIVEKAKLELVQIPKWDDVEIPFMSLGSPQDASKDDEH